MSRFKSFAWPCKLLIRFRKSEDRRFGFCRALFRAHRRNRTGGSIPATTSHSNPQPIVGSACSRHLGVTGHKSGHKCLERTTGQLLNVLRQKLRPDRHEISFLFTVLAAVGSADSIEDESNRVKVRFHKGLPPPNRKDVTRRSLAEALCPMPILSWRLARAGTAWRSPVVRFGQASRP